MKPVQLGEKEFHFLLELYNTPSTMDIHEFLKHSEILVEQTTLYSSDSSQDYRLHLTVAPEIFKKHQGYLNEFKRSLRDKFRITFNQNITGTNIYPDLSVYKIINNSYVAQITPWENINTGQEELLRKLKNATSITDYQSIGLASRIMIQKVADLVFDPPKHIPKKQIDLSFDKYKNRLHTYIDSEFREAGNNEIRQFADSIIEWCEKAIKLANTVTHDLKASSLMAESSVIGVLTVINIIRLIEKK